MQDKIKELELDLKELKFLLEEIKRRKEFISIARRCTGRLLDSLKEIQDQLKSMDEAGEQPNPEVELIKAFSLNDVFRFSRELFDGDTDKMNRVLKEVSQMSAFADVTLYLSSQIKWDEEDEITKEFIELLKKYFV